MPVDLKYGRITCEHGSIGEDEPVVVFRAQDILLPAVLDYYRALCADTGSPQHHLDAVDESRRRIEMWQSRNGCRQPNSDQYVARVAAESPDAG